MKWSLDKALCCICSSELLAEKAEAANTLYESCVSCGRRCEDNRAAGKLGKN